MSYMKTASLSIIDAGILNLSPYALCTRYSRRRLMFLLSFVDVYISAAPSCYVGCQGNIIAKKYGSDMQI